MTTHLYSLLGNKMSSVDPEGDDNGEDNGVDDDHDS